MAPCAASRRASRLPDFSRLSKLIGMVAMRLVSCRADQNESVIFTAVNGTGWSISNGAVTSVRPSTFTRKNRVTTLGKKVFIFIGNIIRLIWTAPDPPPQCGISLEVARAMTRPWSPPAQ